MTKINKSAIRIILLGLLLALGACQALENTDPKYQDASLFINSIADKLGRTKENQIVSRRLQSSWGELYSYDYIEIVFATETSPVQLGAQLAKLESNLNEKGIVFRSSIPGGPDGNPIERLQREGLALTLDHLSFKLGENNLHKEDLPQTTEWIYKSTKALVVMEIDLMEPNAKGDKWMYGDKAINGNIVILKLYLPYF